MPLTTGSVTIKTAGGDYSTWAAFWDDLGNLTGNITCTVDASAFTESGGPATVTETLGGFTLHVLPASFPTTTDASTGARFTFNTANIVLQMEMEGAGAIIIEGIVFIEGTSEPSQAIAVFNVSTNFDLTFRRNIVKGCGQGFNVNDATLLGYKVYNNIFYDVSGQCLDLNYDSPTAIIANNTIVNAGRGVDAGDEELTFENNLVYGSGVVDWQSIGTLTAGNNNADSDATGEDADWGGGGANNVNSIGDPFNAIGSDDFRITAEGVVGTAGKDLSGSFTDDFFGVTRVNWTIGACEFVTPPTEITATVEPEVEIGLFIKVQNDATVEAEAEIGISLTHAVEATVEPEVALTTLLSTKVTVEATAEPEVEIAISLTHGVEATAEAEVEVGVDIKVSNEATAESEVEIGASIKQLVEATAEAEIAVTTHFLVQVTAEATVEPKIEVGRTIVTDAGLVTLANALLERASSGNTVVFTSDLNPTTADDL